MAYFSMGQDTHQVPMQMHARHRQRLSNALGDASNVACFFEGGSEQSKYDTDTNWDFRQESNFQWLFGVKEPGCFGAVVAGKGYLFVPRLEKIYETWFGPIKPLEWFATTYEVETVRYVD